MYHDPNSRSPAELLDAWPTLVEVAAAVRLADVEICVVQAADTDAVIVRDNVTFHFVSERKPRHFRLPMGPRVPLRPDRLLALVRKLRPALIHLQGLGFPLQARWLASSFPGVPILAQDHASRAPQGWRRMPSRWGFGRLAGVAFTARAQAAPFFAQGVFRSELPVFEIVEGSTRFTPGDQAVARSVSGVTGEPGLIWIGNLIDRKDPLTVLEAVSRAVGRLPRLALTMCYASAPLLPLVLDRIARDAGLAGRVRLVGPVEHRLVEQYLRAADFLMQGSHFEGSGYSVIEALACGTTPLVTDIPPFRKITDDGRVGGLSPIGDADAMTGTLLEWSGRDRGELRRRARAHFERELSFDAIGRQLRLAYDTLLASRGRGQVVS